MIMTNLEKYNAVFCENLNVTDTQLADLKYQSVPEWDSVGHMSLVAAIEDAFDIMLDPEDILEFTSYDNAKAILAKYDIEL